MSYPFDIMGELHLGRTSHMVYTKTPAFVRTDGVLESPCAAVLNISFQHTTMDKRSNEVCEISYERAFQSNGGSAGVVCAARMEAAPLEKRDVRARPA